MITLPPEEELIEQFKRMRADTNVSEEELAELLKTNQPVISKILRKKRSMRYEEAQAILSVLTSKLSSIPAEMKAEDIATLTDRLETAYDDEPLRDVAGRMFEKGYSQLPVKNREKKMEFRMITELSVLKLLLTPKIDLRGLKVEDAPLEEMPTYPYDASLRSVAESLLHYYAVLITRDGEIAGIITRADLLKLC